MVDLTTARCRIRPMEERDLDDFMAYRNNDEWMRHQSFKGLTRAAYRRALLGPPVAEDGVQLAIEHRQSARLIGDIYLRWEGGTWHLGYTITPAMARQGYALEAAGAVVEWVWRQGARRVAASAAPQNAASAALLQKLGFTRLGVDAYGDVAYELCAQE